MGRGSRRHWWQIAVWHILFLILTAYWLLDVIPWSAIFALLSALCCRIRWFEETVLANFPRGMFYGTTHTYLGQEADAVECSAHIGRVGILFSAITAAMGTSWRMVGTRGVCSLS